MVDIAKSDINMDDVFGAIGGINSTDTPKERSRQNSNTQQYYSVPPAENESKTNSRRSTSSHIYTSHILDEPKSRTSTRASEESKTSTIKAAPAYHPEPAERANPAVQRIQATARPRTLDPTLSNSTMSMIFNSVGVPKSPVGSPVHDYDHAIGDLDAALAGEEDGLYHPDRESVGSFRVVGGRRQSNMSTGSDMKFAANSTANQVVSDSFRDLNLNGNGLHDRPPSEPLADYDNVAHHDYAPSEPDEDFRAIVNANAGHHRGSSLSQPRIRTMTMDTSVSEVESRTGGFDVHDEYGRFTGDEINIYHDEVAYERPPEPEIHTPPQKRESVHTGETYNLKQLQREVAEAKRQQSLLASQVERERAEVERLKLKKQQSIAQEAAIRAANLHNKQNQRGWSPSSGHSNNRSSSRTTTPVNQSSQHHHYQPPYQPNPMDYRTYSEHSETMSMDSMLLYAEEHVKPSKVAQHQKDHGEVISCVNGVDLIVPEYVVVEGFSKNPRINKVIIGGPSELNSEEDKVVLLFGPVGSGKTSAVNSMLNYLYDVKRNNHFRFVLDEKPKKTTGLTAYVINNSVLPFNVTIVDTPGVVNQMGDKTVSTLIKQWLEQELLESGTFRMDAISIVLRHDQNQLGWPFIHELATVKHMFGDDLKTNVLPIVTNSEVLPQPIAVRSLAAANISFVEYYKVNNAGFSVEPPHDITKLKHMLFFTHGMASLDSFFRDLQELIHPLIAILRNPNKRPHHPKHIDTEALY